MEKQIWFTSDLHLCHNRDFLYQPRGFKNVWEMNEAIVNNWNSLIHWNDDVYLLGDIMLNDNFLGLEFFKSLKGNIHIIIGNHDTDTRIELYNTCYNVVEIAYATIIKQGRFTAYLSHYPTMMGNFKENYGPVCLHGHTHSKDPFQYAEHRCYNVALDAHDNKPISIEQVRADITKYKEGL